MNGSITQLREAFYSNCEEEYGFSREEIIKTLSELGGSFSKDRIAEYRNRLADKYHKRLELENKAKALGRKVSEIPCPICGADTIGNSELFGRITRTPGWECMEGGKKHFRWWKINQIRANLGLEPIDFLHIDWDNYKLHSQQE